MMFRFFCALLIAGIAYFADSGSYAAGDFEVTVVIKDHRFEPAEIKVPPAVRVKLTVINQDPTPEEFECPQLKLEKVIAGESRGVLRFGPVTPGTYRFVGEFNEATAQGSLIVEQM